MPAIASAVATGRRMNGSETFTNPTHGRQS